MNKKEIQETTTSASLGSHPMVKVGTEKPLRRKMSLSFKEYLSSLKIQYK